MKKHIKRLSYLLLPFILSLPMGAGIARAAATAGEHPSRHPGDYEDVTKRVLINKSYTVTADDKLDIDNQFGDVLVSTWDKDQITVDIEITATASTDEKATAAIDRIKVQDSQNGKTISFKSEVGNMKNNDNNDKHNENGKHNSNQHFSINYIVHMPVANPLNLKNQFGKIVVPDLRGSVNLTSKFGSLTAGKLSNVDAVDVEFGSANIEEISNGKLALKFDGASEIRKIGGNVKIGIEFSSLVQLGLDDNTGDLTIAESYSDIRMVLTKEFSADFKIHTSFGDLHNDIGVTLQERKGADSDVGPHFDKDFEGKAGDGKAKITVKSSFGSIRLSHDWHGTTT